MDITKVSVHNTNMENPLYIEMGARKFENSEFTQT